MTFFSIQNNLQKEVSKLLQMVQVYENATYEIKRKTIHILLKDTVVSEAEMFRDSMAETVDFVFRTKTCNDDKVSREADIQTLSRYDEENKYFYCELLKDTASKPIGVSSILWNQFPKITDFLKTWLY